MQPKSHCDQSRLSAIITALVGLTGCSHSEWHSPLNGRHRCRNPEDRRCLRVLGNCAHDTLRYCSQKTAALACHSKVRPACHSWTHRTGSACFVFAEYGRMVGNQPQHIQPQYNQQAYYQVGVVFIMQTFSLMLSPGKCMFQCNASTIGMRTC